MFAVAPSLAGVRAREEWPETVPASSYLTLSTGCKSELERALDISIFHAFATAVGGLSHARQCGKKKNANRQVDFSSDGNRSQKVPVGRRFSASPRKSAALWICVWFQPARLDPGVATGRFGLDSDIPPPHRWEFPRFGGTFDRKGRSGENISEGAIGVPARPSLVPLRWSPRVSIEAPGSVSVSRPARG